MENQIGTLSTCQVKTTDLINLPDNHGKLYTLSTLLLEHFVSAEIHYFAYISNFIT